MTQENKSECKERGCKKETWRGVCNGYCVKHHNKVCMDNPQPTKEQSEENMEILQIVNKAAGLGLRTAGRVWLEKKLYQQREQAKQEERERIKSRVGILRQLLNEERIKDDKLIDNKYIEDVLEI